MEVCNTNKCPYNETGCGSCPFLIEENKKMLDKQK